MTSTTETAPTTPTWRGPPWWGHRGYWHRRRRITLGLSVVVGAIQVWGSVLAASKPWGTGGQLDGLAYALLLAGPVALIVRRVAPLATLAVAVLAADAY